MADDDPFVVAGLTPDEVRRKIDRDMPPAPPPAATPGTATTAPPASPNPAAAPIRQKIDRDMPPPPPSRAAQEAADATKEKDPFDVLRQAFGRDPNYQYSDLPWMPIAANKETGKWSLAVPGPLHDRAVGAVDVLGAAPRITSQGLQPGEMNPDLTPRITPEGTMALASIVPGLQRLSQQSALTTLKSMTPVENRITNRAYELWQKDGSPKAADDATRSKYWETAKKEVGAEVEAENAKTPSKVTLADLFTGTGGFAAGAILHDVIGSLPVHQLASAGTMTALTLLAKHFGPKVADSALQNLKSRLLYDEFVKSGRGGTQPGNFMSGLLGGAAAYEPAYVAGGAAAALPGGTAGNGATVEPLPGVTSGPAPTPWGMSGPPPTPPPYTGPATYKGPNPLIWADGRPFA